MSTPIVNIQNLTKQYRTSFSKEKKDVLKGVSLQIQKGDVYGLVGRNGAGKSTLMKCITGIANPTSGMMELFGETNPKELYHSRARMGAIIEQPPIDEDFSAWDNLKVCAIRMGIKDERIKEVLQLTGLWEHGEAAIRKEHVRTYSLGMKQRLGIALALLGKPELLILDEPLNGLDPEGIMWFRELVRNLNQTGVSFIISSHLLRELDEVATRYGIMKGGKIIDTISVDELRKIGISFEDHYKSIVSQ